MALQQFLTYQHNVQRYFREHADKYDGVMIPLSIATSFASGTYGFVRALCSHDPTKQYAIDPRTALFQKKWDRSNVRDPHKKMAEVFRGPFASEALDQALDPRDFESDQVVQEIGKNCMDFQLGFRVRDEDTKKLNKYKKLLGLETLHELSQPQFLIPPYFEFKEAGDDWYSVSTRFLECAATAGYEIPIRPVLHFGSWPAPDQWRLLLDELQSLEISSCFVYPNNFKEHDVAQLELDRYRIAVQQSIEYGVAPFAMFGGYFSVLLSYCGLEGFCNGIGYGEWRDSGYHSGGIAANRIYILKLHRYLDPPRAQDIIDRDPEYFAGDTDLLSACVDAGRPLRDLSMAECHDHFMECRQREVEFVSQVPVDDAKNELLSTSERLAQIGPLEHERYGTSLEKWAAALDQ